MGRRMKLSGALSTMWLVTSFSGGLKIDEASGKAIARLVASGQAAASVAPAALAVPIVPIPTVPGVLPHAAPTLQEPAVDSLVALAFI
jgi:hypothetical protein